MRVIETVLSPLKAWRDALWKRWVLPLGLAILLEEVVVLDLRTREGSLQIFSSHTLVPALGAVLGVVIIVLRIIVLRRTSTKNIPDKMEPTSANPAIPGNDSTFSFGSPQSGLFADVGPSPGESKVEEGPGAGDFRTVPPYLRNERIYTMTETRSLILPKEGYDPKRCADKAAIQEQLGRYAVADGATRSFLPAQWAEILVTHFVEQPRNFQSPKEFMGWLLSCSNEWYTAAQQWIERTRQSGLSEDWESSLQEGAQATFVGCVLIKENGNTFARVFAVGDANFFLLRPQAVPDEWECYAYPLQKPEDFSALTDTLWTPRKRIQHVPEVLKVQDFTVQSGDYIVLATDALARWMLTPPVQQRCEQVLRITSLTAFWELVQRERQQNTMELDDTTMLVIPIR
jgi:hypothetical protein